MENNLLISINTELTKNCENCGTPFFPKKRTNKDQITKTCSKKCMYELRQKSYIKSHNCKNSHCGKMFTTAAKNADGYCSVMCRSIGRSQTKYQGTEGIDYIVCPLCNLRTRQFNPRHAQMHGFASINEMQKSLNLPLVTCEKKKEKSQGENNPGYQHSGKLSPMSKNYIHGYNKEWHNNLINDNRARNLEQPELFKTNIAYWLKHANGDEELAHELYMKFQIRNLVWFVDRYGKEEGTIRYKNRINKWQETLFNKSQEEKDIINKKKSSIGGRSKGEIELYNELRKIIPGIYDRLILERDVDEFQYYWYDMYFENKIIEYHGTYWHADPRKYDITFINSHNKLTYTEIHNRDNDKLRIAESQGFKILVVWEQDFKLNKNKVIHKCIQFLKQ